jgi:hypothetical protein
MTTIADALDGLEPEAIRRILKWATDRFQVRPTAADVLQAQAEAPRAPAVAATYSDFPTLFVAANPQSAPDKAMVAAYWFQVLQGQQDFDSFTLSKELKHLGHPSTNITRDLDALIGRTPRLVIQTRKLGTTKQARKQYKLTHEGIKAVERMLSGNGEA